jgi:hypothetical protein
MNQNHETTTTQYKGHYFADVAYSFSSEKINNGSMQPTHVFLDILFMHPRTAEVVNLRSVVPAYLLCQSKEVVESAVHQEIHNALSFQGASTVHESYGFNTTETVNKRSYAY